MLYFFLACFLAGSALSLAEETTEQVFTSIYDQAIWGKDESGKGTSGGGSTIEATEEYRAFLQDFLKRHSIKSVVDVGCGDWQFSRLIHWGDIQYTGIDIVKPVIERNQKAYSTPSIAFIHGNGIYMDLPKADLLLCKDVLQHLSDEDIMAFTHQFGKFKHCLITNDADVPHLSNYNCPIKQGEWRTLDLTRSPFAMKGTKVLTYNAKYTLKEVLHVEAPNKK